MFTKPAFQPQTEAVTHLLYLNTAVNFIIKRQARSSRDQVFAHAATTHR